MLEIFHSFEEYRQRFFPEECERERWEKLTAAQRFTELWQRAYEEVFGKERDDRAD